MCKETDKEAELCPTMVVYPQGVWYKNVTTGDVDEIIEKHFKKGEPIDRLAHFKLS
jgi:(2Fe-2S) ferredoxin